MKIAVRTYKRSDTILKKTLGLLALQEDLDLANDLYIVVADEDERRSYQKVLELYPFADFIVSGVGCHTAANAVIDHFPEGERFICMDDDLADLRIWKDIKDSKSRVTVTILGAYFQYIFDRMDESKLGSIFGIDSAPNWTFKQDKPFFEFKARRVGGAWWGGYTSNLMKSFQSHEEDNIRTSNALNAHGGVYSLNWMSVNTKFGLNPGGMQASDCRANANHERAARTLQMCHDALSDPVVAKYYESEPYYKESMEFNTLRLKNIRELRQIIPNYEEVSWSGYMQATPDRVESKASLDSFF